MLDAAPSFDFTPTQWLIAAIGAVLVGISKTGIAGVSILFVALFALVFPSTKQASGLVLPLLILADWVAVYTYRRHLQWRYLVKLIPWTACGVVGGYFALRVLSDHDAKTLTGGIILSMAGLAYALRFKLGDRPEPPKFLGSWSVAAAIGILAGVTTLIANAAGPLMAIYLIAMRLPKLAYVGTAAVFFALLNLFKVPFMVSLGLISWHSLKFNLLLAPAVLGGTLAGRWLLTRIDQRVFERIVLGLAALGGFSLLL